MSVTIDSNSYDEVHSVTICNKSDIKDDYVYPTVSFKASSSDNDYNIRIINTTDNPSRVFAFSGLSVGEELLIDNELRHISSSLSGEKLSNFNKNWLRLKPGDNELQLQLTGSATITCPTYVTIGF